MSRDDLSYYQRRAEEESDRAQRAASPEIAAVHRELAGAYLERASLSEQLKRNGDE